MPLHVLPGRPAVFTHDGSEAEQLLAEETVLVQARPAGSGVPDVRGVVLEGESSISELRQARCLHRPSHGPQEASSLSVAAVQGARAGSVQAKATTEEVAEVEHTLVVLQGDGDSPSSHEGCASVVRIRGAVGGEDHPGEGAALSEGSAVPDLGSNRQQPGERLFADDFRACGPRALQSSQRLARPPQVDAEAGAGISGLGLLTAQRGRCGAVTPNQCA